MRDKTLGRLVVVVAAGMAMVSGMMMASGCQKDDSPLNQDNDGTELSDGPFDQWDTIQYPYDTASTAWPKACTMWMGHLVIAVDSLNSHEANITLLSLRDWSRMTSAAHAETPTMATDSAGSYGESEIHAWHIPSEAEARWLKSNYGEGTTKLQSANRLLQSAQADTIALSQGSQNARYLCAEATKSFSLRENTNVTAAGATIKNYHLRLIANIHITR